MTYVHHVSDNVDPFSSVSWQHAFSVASGGHTSGSAVPPRSLGHRKLTASARGAFCRGLSTGLVDLGLAIDLGLALVEHVLKSSKRHHGQLLGHVGVLLT